LVTLVSIQHHRRDLFVPAEVPDLIKADAGLLALLNRHGNRRMPQTGRCALLEELRERVRDFQGWRWRGRG
jgi:hypothetical protein